MGIINTIFGKTATTETSKINWIPLNNLAQLNTIAESSANKTALIFKHSTRCSVSRMVLKQFENTFQLHNNIDCYFLDLLENRDISNQIAARFNVHHQSPQLIVLKNKLSVYNASHENIDALELDKFI